MRRRWIAGLIICLGVIVIAALVLALGDDDSATTSDTTTPVSSSAPPGIPQELQDCLEEQGVETPQASSNGGVPSALDAGQLEVLQACQEFLPDDIPSGGGFPTSPGG